MQRIFQTILRNFLAAPGWEDEVRNLAAGVVDSTIEIYNTILRDLRPTPAKSHYQFNLRDISKVFQGVLMVLPAKFKTAASFIRLYTHENQRIFGDRLINTEDHVWFDELLLKCTKKHCGVDEVEPCVIADFMVLTRRRNALELDVVAATASTRSHESPRVSRGEFRDAVVPRRLGVPGRDTGRFLDLRRLRRLVQALQDGYWIGYDWYRDCFAVHRGRRDC